MRFKGDGCAYSDKLNWFSKEYVAYNRESGFLSGSYTSESQLESKFNHHERHGGCVEKAGRWSWFEVTLAFGIKYIKFHWWGWPEIKTWYPFSQTVRYTSTTKEHPSKDQGWYTIKNSLNQNLCIDLSGAQTHNGNKVQLWTCNGTKAQKWYLDSSGRLRSEANLNKCIEAGSRGYLYDDLFIWDCHNGVHQQWVWQHDGRIRNKSYEKYIGVIRGCNGVYSGDILELYNKVTGGGNCEGHQKWVN